MIKVILLFFVFIAVVFYCLRFLITFLFGGLVSKANKQARTNTNRTRTSSSNKTQTPAPKKKIINSDEGEYVDFEEIKD